jgi:hypothetical protein
MIPGYTCGADGGAIDEAARSAAQGGGCPMQGTTTGAAGFKTVLRYTRPSDLYKTFGSNVKPGSTFSPDSDVS